MKFEILSQYPASAAVVMRMFMDPAFHTGKLEALGALKYRVLEQKAEGDSFRIRIERKVPLDAPALIRKVVPAETTAVSEERWNRSTMKGRVSVEPGVPVDMSCEASMSDVAGGQCLVRYAWEVRARVPLIGGALEKFIGSDLERKMVDETRVAVGLLEKYR